MVEASMTLRLLFALALTATLPSLALAQDDAQADGGDQAQPARDAAATPEPVDPVDAVQGLWHVDQVEGSAANETMTGGILKVDRQAISSLSGGTCSNPGFTASSDAADPKQVGVDITCLGQVLASARWNTDDPDTVDWSEPDLDVVLHRVKVATTAQQPASDEDKGGSDDSE
jgi:hypothetical protein